MHSVIVDGTYVKHADWPDVREIYRTENCPAFQPPEYALEADILAPYGGTAESRPVLHATFPMPEQILEEICADFDASQIELWISPTHCLIDLPPKKLVQRKS